MSDTDQARGLAALGDCQRWLELAVIGLGLCPFARGVAQHGQIAWQFSTARDTEQLHADLDRSLSTLVDTPPERIDTLLLVLPWVLQDFFNFNDYLDHAEALLVDRGLVGELQIASFHPAYCFAGEPAADPANNSNRSPWPILHLLREASLQRVLEKYPDADVIPQRNIELLRALGQTGWEKLDVGRGSAKP